MKTWKKTLYNTLLHRFTPTVDGDYRLCFDNTFSRVSPKVVFFELFLDDNTEGEGEEDLSKFSFDGENIQDQLDITVKDFVVSFFFFFLFSKFNLILRSTVVAARRMMINRHAVCLLLFRGVGRIEFGLYLTKPFLV